MNEIVQAPALQPAGDTAAGAAMCKQNLLDLDRVGLSVSSRRFLARNATVPIR